MKYSWKYKRYSRWEDIRYKIDKTESEEITKFQNLKIGNNPLTAMNQHTCTNCGNTFTDEFCNKCGQKITHRITLKHIFHDIAHAFTHADKGFLNLFLQLFVRPGIVAREYIAEGKRKKYFSPFQYILILGSIAAFVAVNSHFMQNAMQVVGTSGASSKRQLELMQNISNYQNKYYNFMILLQLPFFALSSFWLYRKYKFNYAEHLTLQTFITAQITLVAMLSMLIVAISGKPGIYIALVMTMLSILFQVFSFMQFFKERSFKGVVKALAAYILGLILFGVILTLIVIIITVIVILSSKK
jgi:Protein of unknown function (DUF3667)